MTTLKVSEIFHSIQGEGLRSGRPCVLVRLAGCNLRCTWCDTEYARDEPGEDMTVEQIVQAVEAFGCPLVEVTGGEPLVQPGAAELLEALCEAGWETLLETNGSMDVSSLDPRVIRIVDFKCPASGCQAHNLWSNVEALTDRDEVKFVLADREDYDYARRALTGRGLAGRCPVTFAPVAGRLEAATLAEWILADGLDVRLGLQLHKMIWPDRPRGI